MCYTDCELLSRGVGIPTPFLLRKGISGLEVEVVVALIGLAGTVMAALGGAAITAWFTTRRMTIEMKLKMDILWEIYAEDALREARKEGLMQRNSPERISDQWYTKVPEELQYLIEKDIEVLSVLMDSPYDMSLEIYGKYREELKAIAIANDWPIQAVLGVIHKMCKEARRESIDNGLHQGIVV